VRLYLEGTNFRRIGRVLGVNHQSVINWVNAYHASLLPAESPVTAPEILEMNELFTVVGSKKGSLMWSRPSARDKLRRRVGGLPSAHDRSDAGGH
jgi:hypothetical protein